MRRVAITGMGIVSCLGNSVDEVTASLQQGRSGIETLPERKEMGFRSCLSGTIKGFAPPELPKANRSQMDKRGLMAASAVQQAIEDSGLTEEEIRNDRTGILVGNGGSGHEVYQAIHAFHSRRRLLGTAAPRSMCSSVSANLSVWLKTRGHCYTIACACASSAVAIGHGADLIRLGRQDRILAGGVQDCSWEYHCLFDSLRVFSVREDRPEEAMRPFDKDRDGLVPSGGAGIVVLENYAQATARGAPIYAELIGYATNSDGFDITRGSGTGAVACMRLTLENAGLKPDAIDYINAHATSTPEGDIVEAQSIAQIFGKRPLVSSTKSMTGHEIAACSSNELLYTLLMMQHGFVAPSINVEELDERCTEINLVMNQPIDTSIEIAMSNSFGFGGVNACLIVKRP